MKKIIKVSVFCATVLTLASSAQALDLNMFGASAEVDFWTEAAPQFLAASVADGGMGCTNVVSGKADSKNGVAKGFNCAGAPSGDNTVTLRYTADKSVEGPRAVMGMDPNNLDTCSTLVNTPSFGDDHYRMMANISDDGLTLSKGCNRVNLGASDVASESFTQESHGNMNGIYDTAPFNEVLDPSTIPGADTPGMISLNPIFVPFSFFANKNLTATDNLTRLQAVLLMSGNVSNWSQFGYPAARVALCMRHAGSGTHATLDRAVMRGDRPLVINQNTPPAFVAAPTIYFHESSSDLMKCVQNNAGIATGAIAVGYADTDKTVSSIAADGSEVINAAYNNTKRLTYNGIGAGMSAGKTVSDIKTQIANGLYDFWSAQWIYMNTNQLVNLNAEAAANLMMAYAANPATLPQATKKYYWLAKNELKVQKENDAVLPHF